MQQLKVEFYFNTPLGGDGWGEIDVNAHNSILETIMGSVTIPIDGLTHDVLRDLQKTKDGREWSANLSKLSEERTGYKNDVESILVRASHIPFKPLEYRGRYIPINPALKTEYEFAKITSISPRAACLELEGDINCTNGPVMDGLFRYTFETGSEKKRHCELLKDGEIVKGNLIGQLDRHNIRRQWIDKTFGFVRKRFPQDFPLHFVRQSEFPVDFGELFKGIKSSTIRVKLIN